MEFWRALVHIPLPVLLAVTTTIGYMVGRWRHTGEICPRCKEELRHAHALAAEPKP